MRKVRAQSGKVFVVIGADGGLGRVVAEVLKQKCESTIVCLDSKYTSRKFSKFSNNLYLEITSEKSINRAFTLINKKYGRLDAVVNCAGIVQFNSIEDTTLCDWKRILDVNLTGAFLCSRAASKYMKLQGFGRIVHIGSLSDHVALPGNVAYSSSKAGLRMLSMIFNEEYARYGVYTTLLSLGAVATSVWQQYPRFKARDMLPPEDVADFLAQILSKNKSVRIDEIKMFPKKGRL